MDTIFLDLQTTYIPFTIQSTDGDGTKTDPTAVKLVIYEEDGADAIFTTEYIEDPNSKIGTATIGGGKIGTPGGSYTPSKINSKTGFYGEMIPKSMFTAGKNYIFLWELTIDSVVTAARETFFMINTSSFKPS